MQVDSCPSRAAERRRKQRQLEVVVGAVPLGDIARMFGIETGGIERLVDADRQLTCLLEPRECGIVVTLVTRESGGVLLDHCELHQGIGLTWLVARSRTLLQRLFGFTSGSSEIGFGVIRHAARSCGSRSMRLLEMRTKASNMIGVLTMSITSSLAACRGRSWPRPRPALLRVRNKAAQLQQLGAQVNVLARVSQQRFESVERQARLVELAETSVCLRQPEHRFGQQARYRAARIHRSPIVLHRVRIVAPQHLDGAEREHPGGGTMLGFAGFRGELQGRGGVGGSAVEISAHLMHSTARGQRRPAVVVVPRRVVAALALSLDQQECLIESSECCFGIATIEVKMMCELMDANGCIIAGRLVGAAIGSLYGPSKCGLPSGVSHRQLGGGKFELFARSVRGGIKAQHADQFGRAPRKLPGLSCFVTTTGARKRRRARMDRCARSVAINLAWRELEIAAPAFTNREGRVLARALKCLLDPLVLQPRINTEIGSAVLDAEQMARLRELLAAAQQRLESASRWYELLRAQRRAQRITAGNAQELYFPRAFELATQLGEPGADAAEHCREMLAEVHSLGGDAEMLRAAFDASETVARLETKLQREWDAAIAQSAPLTDERLTELAAATRTVLSEPERSRDARRSWGMLRDHLAAELGGALRVQPRVVERFAAAAQSDLAAQSVTCTSPLAAPALTAEVEHPGALDRSIEGRVRAAIRRLQTSGFPVDRELLDEELERSCEAFGLRDTDLAATFVAGMLVAGWVRPLESTTHAGAPQALHHTIARARNEAYVLYLRRALHSGRGVHPEQEPVVDDLQDFARHYLRRLWTRLHGRDVLEVGLDLEHEATDLLEGIVRSTLHDQRQRMRRALEQFGS